MAKQKKHGQDIKDRVILAKQNEKIINDFLLQFAYTLTIGVVTIFMYNGIALHGYGYEAHKAMVSFMSAASVVTFILGIIFAVWYKLKDKKSLKTLSVYSFVTAIIALWYISDKVVDKINIAFISNLYPTITKAILLIFPLLGIALIVEFAVYFIRYYKLNGKKKK